MFRAQAAQTKWRNRKSDSSLVFREHVLAKGYWRNVLIGIREQRHAPPSTFNEQYMPRLKKAKAQWEETTLPSWTSESPERKTEFRNLSDIPLARIYTPLDISYQDYAKQEGLP